MQCFGDSQREKSFGDHPQKNTIQYAERDEQKRAEFIEKIEALPEDSELYFVDESGFDEYYAREYGYAPRGEKIEYVKYDNFFQYPTERKTSKFVRACYRRIIAMDNE